MCAVGLLTLFPFPPSWVSPQQASLEPLCSDGHVKGPTQTLHTAFAPSPHAWLCCFSTSTFSRVLHHLTAWTSSQHLALTYEAHRAGPYSSLFNLIYPSPLYMLCSGHKYRLPVPPGLCLSTSPHIVTCQVVLILSLGTLLSVLSPHAASSVRSSLAPPGRSPREHARHPSNYCTVLGLLFDML